MIPVFYDTWAWLALANRADPHHAVAVEADEHLERVAAVAVTSDWILDETLTGLNARAGSAAALALLEHFELSIAAGDLTLLHVSVMRRDRALTLFKRLAKDTPRLSLTDCTSFALMHELSIEHAFTADAHFRKGGKRIRPIFERRAGELVFHMPR